MDNELYHFGILGQKWGIRRFQNEDGSLTDEGRRRYMRGPLSRNRKEKPKTARQTAALLSDDDLRKAIDRMNLELRYVEAMSKLNPPTLKRSHGALKKFAQLGEGMAKKMLDGIGDVAVNSLKKAFGDKEEDKYSKAKKESQYWTNMENAAKMKKAYESRSEPSSSISNNVKSVEKGKKTADSIISKYGDLVFKDDGGIEYWMDAI